jgi:NAD(P)-dependent dehydrogenase (short-subunit alcohol dehydrogenase family)
MTQTIDIARLYDLTGKVAIVTGAASGMGREIARYFAAASAAVVVADWNAPGAERVASELIETGARAIAVTVDVSDEASVIAMMARVKAEFGRLDILVNNAGIAPGNLAEEVREEDFDLTLAVNLKGTFFASQAAGRVMIRHHGGRIVNLSSQAGFVALPTESVYCMTKAAIAHLTKCLAIEWGQHNITVNAVAPTFIHTPGTEEALADPAFRADTIERIAALHRIGEPMDVAGAVVFLASPAASLITGHTLLIDGGWTAR